MTTAPGPLPPDPSPLALEGGERPPPRLAWTFLASAFVLALGAALVAFALVSDAAEDRLRLEVERTARLLGGSGFPLGDASVRRVADFIGADVVVVDGGGRVLAASLPPEGRRAFAAAREQGLLPQVGEAAAIGEARLGHARVTVGAAPAPSAARPGLEPQGRGALYVLYPEDVLAAQRRRLWLPLAIVAAASVLLAAVLGKASERAVQRARTSALLRLLVSVAHELRNPLGAIRSLAQSLRGPGVDREPLDLIAAEAERLGLLVEGLRSVGRPVQTVREALDPDAAVAAVLDLLEHQLAHRRVVVTRRLEARGVVVDADPTQLRQVVLNLVQNAADAQPRGGAVRVSSEATGSRWRLVVEDDGPGVPEGARDRLFEPFFTTKPKGLGVGLYLSRRLVVAHGGRLELEATPAPGARFVLSLPARPPAPRPGARPSDLAQVTRP